MSRDPQPGTHYIVALGVSVVDGEARWTAGLHDVEDGEQIGSATVGATATRALDQLGAFLVEHTTQHTQED